MKITKRTLLIILIAIGISANAQTFTKAVAVKVSDSLSVRLDNYVAGYNHDLNRNAFLDYCAFERANYFISILETTAKSKGLTIWECGEKIPRGTKARKAHKELFGDPDFFVESKVPFVKGLRVFKEQNLEVQSEIMVPIFWEGKYSKRKGLQEIIQKAVSFHSKTGSISGDILESYKRSKAHNEAIVEDGNGEFGLSTIILVQETQDENGRWIYDVVIYNVVVFCKQIN